jgi:glucan phosphoethanolaminetransferase (alkaline phosphatase superfamily)
MELDDLKKSWQQFDKDVTAPGRDISQILKSSSDQPLAKLKRRFRKGIILMPLIAAIVYIEFSHKHSFGSQFLVYYLVSFSLIMMVYFYVNYRLVSKMQKAEGDLHSTLVLQTKTLKRLIEMRLILMRSAIALFFISLELIMYARQGEGYNNWYANPFPFRLVVYFAVFIFFFFFTRLAINHRYKKHIEHLQHLLNEFDDD